MFELRSMGASWEQIAERLPERTPDAVRLEYHRRWRTDMQPALPKEGAKTKIISLAESKPRIFWTPEEDSRLLDGLRAHGKAWRKILAMLPGRTDSSVRNRAKRLTGEETEPPTRSLSIGSKLAADHRAASRPSGRSKSLDAGVLSAGYTLPAQPLPQPLLLPAGLASKSSSSFVSSDVPSPRVLSDVDSSSSRHERDSRRDRGLGETSARRTRHEELDELSNLSAGALEELSSSLRSLGLISGYTGARDAQISLDDLASYAHDDRIDQLVELPAATA